MDIDSDIDMTNNYKKSTSTKHKKINKSKPKNKTKRIKK